jgi:hypothetical protein
MAQISSTASCGMCEPSVAQAGAAQGIDSAAAVLELAKANPMAIDAANAIKNVARNHVFLSCLLYMLGSRSHSPLLSIVSRFSVPIISCAGPLGYDKGHFDKPSHNLQRIACRIHREDRAQQ